MFSERQSEYLGIVGLVIMSAGLLLLVAYLAGQVGNDPDPFVTWNSEFAFTSATPTVDLAPEGGWWDEISTKPAALPTLPEIDLYSTATSGTPAAVSSTKLAPATPTRTPLFTPLPEATKEK